MEKKDKVDYISCWVKKTRQELGYSQKEFSAEILGISSRQYVRIENEGSEMSLIQFMNVCNKLNLPRKKIFDFLCGIEENAKKK